MLSSLDTPTEEKVRIWDQLGDDGARHGAGTMKKWYLAQVSIGRKGKSSGQMLGLES